LICSKNEGVVLEYFDLYKNLNESGFESLEQKYYFKIMPPVFYCLIINTDGNFEKNINLENIDIKKFCCTNIVCVNVFVLSQNIENVYNEISAKEKEYANIHNVWWIFDTNINKLIVPKGQPSKLNGIEKCFDLYNKNSILKIYNNKPFITYVIIFINIIIWILANINNNIVYNFGISNYGLFLGEFYRLITAVFIHKDIKHLFFNCFTLYVFGRETERVLSLKNYVAIYFLTGVIASLFSALFNNGLSIGASGAIFGIIGSLAALNRSKMYSTQTIDYFTLVLYIIISVFSGFMNQYVDNVAHIAGVLSGFLIQYFYLKIKQAKC